MPNLFARAARFAALLLAFAITPAFAANLSISDVSVTEGNAIAQTATFTVSLSAPATSDVSFDLGTAEINAVGSDDFQPAYGSRTISAGQSSVTFDITIWSDSVVETNETFQVLLSNVTNATLVDGVGVGTIVNDDSGPSATLLIGDMQVSEGNSGTKTATFLVQLSKPAATLVSFNIATANGTAAAGSDYTALNLTNQSIPAGQTTKSFSVTINGDVAAEGNETFTVNLSAASGAAIGRGQALGTIVNDDNVSPVKISVWDVSSITEGSSGTQTVNFTVALSQAATSTVSFDIKTEDSSATAGSDYVAKALTGQTIAIGQTQKTFSVVVNGDTTDEGTERFLVTLGNIVNAAIEYGDTHGVATIPNDDATISIGDITQLEGTATGDTSFSFPVTLSAPLENTVQFKVMTCDGTATAASNDYWATGGLFFTQMNSGTTSMTVHVNVVADDDLEADETFCVDLAELSGAVAGDTHAVATILNDDVPAVPPLQIDDVTMVEGNSGNKAMVFTVRLSEPAGGPVTYDIAVVSDSATPGVDYVPISATGVTIPVGQTQKTFTVQIIGDVDQEPDYEYFWVQLSNIQGAQVFDTSAQGTLLDDDTPGEPTLSVGDVTVAEGSNGNHQVSVPITLSAPPAHDVIFNVYTNSGTASPSWGDFDHYYPSMTIPAGQTSATASITVHGDTEDEEDEYFTVNVSGLYWAVPDKTVGVVTLLDDDGVSATPNLSISDATVTEGNSGTKLATFTMSLSAPSSNSVSFSAGTAGGTATSGVDFQPLSTGGSLAPGETSRVFSVVINGDTAVESDETFSLVVSSVTGAVVTDGTGIGTILNDDSGGGGGTPTLSIGDVSISEGNAATKVATFTVSLSAAQTGPVFFDIATANGTAIAGSDYVAKSTTGVRITAGSTSKTFTVTINGDTTVEPNETFTVNLSNPVGATLADGQATGTINNDDAAGLPTVSISDLSTLEGASGSHTMNFVVILSQGNATPVSFNIATANGTATAGSDYVAASTTVTIPAGQGGGNFLVTVNGDTTAEADETFTVNISNVSGATIADGSAVGTITNDDGGGLPVLSIGDISQTEGGGDSWANFLVTLSAPSATDVTFQAVSSDGSAIAWLDYLPLDVSYTIPAGTTSVWVRTPLVSDATEEPDETFSVTLSNVVGATAPDLTAIATILNDDISGPFLSIADVSVSEGNSGTKTAVFTVTLSAPSASPVSYDIATFHSASTEGEDYLELSQTGQVIPAGQTSKTFSVTVNGDTTEEPNEYFTVNVTNISGALVAQMGDNDATGWIMNDDNSPQLSIDDVTVVERDIGSAQMLFKVRLAAPATRNVIFSIATSNVTATSGSDYQAKTEADRVIWAGQTEATFDVWWTGDTSIESNETFNVTISAFDGSTITKAVGIGTLLNDDLANKPVMSIGDLSITEGNSGQKMANFVVSLSQASTAAASFSAQTFDGTAIAGQDYWWTDQDWSTLTIPAGQTSKAFSVPINGDTTGEPDESFTVSLNTVTGATLGDGTAVGTIVNDDGVSGPNISINDASIVEGNSGTKTINFTVSLSAASASAVSFDVSTASGTAAVGDYVHLGLAGQTIAAGQTSKTVSVTINGDTTVEPDESFSINLSNVVGAFNADSQGVGTITNDDGTPPPTISIGDVSISEGNSLTKQATFTVTLSAAASTAVTYTIATANGTAVAPTDYTAKSLSGQSIPAGTLSKTFTVTIKGDTTTEPDETFVVDVSNVTGATVADGQAVGTITNDDSAATPTLSIADASIAEGDSGTKVLNFTVSLSPAATGTVTFNVDTGNGSATSGSDYVALNLTGQTLAAGATSKTFAVTINGDTATEANETFTVNLGSVTGATLGDGQATGTITNDDGGTTPTLSINDVSVAEGNSLSKQVSFTLTLSAAATSAVTYNIATADGTALAGTDYTAKTQTAQSIAAGFTSKTFVVTVKGDTVVEPNETFVVNLSGVTGATVADGQGTATITNDDGATLTAARFVTRGLYDDIDDGNRAPLLSRDDYALLLFDAAQKLCERTAGATIVAVDGVEHRALLAELADAAHVQCASVPRYTAVMAEGDSRGFLVQAQDAKVLGQPMVDDKAGLTSLQLQGTGHAGPITLLLPKTLPAAPAARTAQLRGLGQRVQGELKSDPHARLVLIGDVTIPGLLDLTKRSLPADAALPGERVLVSPALLKEFGASVVAFPALPANVAPAQVLQLH